MEHYQTIAVFTYASEYAVLKHLLQQSNVRFVFQNETMIGVLPFHSNAFGGIRLKVHPEDIDIAKDIIRNLDDTTELRIV